MNSVFIICDKVHCFRILPIFTLRTTSEVVEISIEAPREDNRLNKHSKRFTEEAFMNI